MVRIGLTQRVVENSAYPERRDALDQRWTDFLAGLELAPVPIPNGLSRVEEFVRELGLGGVVLTGGNDLAECGGEAPERDHLEGRLLQLAFAGALPLLGVCRGMQMIHHHLGGPLQKVAGHAAGRTVVIQAGRNREVNSYHNYGFKKTHPDLVAWAMAPDGVIEAFSHARLNIHGVMWHPERNRPFDQADLALFRRVFGKNP